jgi:hypothetical protein
VPVFGKCTRPLTFENFRQVNRIVKLVLSKDVFKKAVSRSEISIALKGEGVPTSGGNVNSLIAGAKQKLKHVFGFELAECSKDSLYFGEVLSQNTQVTSHFRLPRGRGRECPRAASGWPRGASSRSSAKDRGAAGRWKRRWQRAIACCDRLAKSGRGWGGAAVHQTSATAFFHRPKLLAQAQPSFFAVALVRV